MTVTAQVLLFLVLIPPVAFVSFLAFLLTAETVTKTLDKAFESDGVRITLFVVYMATWVFYTIVAVASIWYLLTKWFS